MRSRIRTTQEAQPRHFLQWTGLVCLVDEYCRGGSPIFRKPNVQIAVPGDDPDLQ